MGLCASRDNQDNQESQPNRITKYGDRGAKPVSFQKACDYTDKSCTIGGTGGLGVSVAPKPESSTSLVTSGESCSNCAQCK
jgi:hypothetical protein